MSLTDVMRLNPGRWAAQTKHPGRPEKPSRDRLKHAHETRDIGGTVGPLVLSMTEQRALSC